MPTAKPACVAAHGGEHHDCVAHRAAIPSIQLQSSFHQQTCGFAHRRCPRAVVLPLHDAAKIVFSKPSLFSVLPSWRKRGEVMEPQEHAPSTAASSKRQRWQCGAIATAR